MISLFLATLFVFTLVQVGATASLKRLDTLTKQCKITLDDYHFDLCPLLNEQHNSGQVDLVLRYETPPTITTIVYNISLDGPLPNAGAVPNDEQCVSGTWTCMTTREYYPGRDLRDAEHGMRAIPIVIEAPQRDLGLDPSVGDREDFGIYAELRKSVEDESPSLSIHMRGSHYLRVPQRVQIDFECAESEDDAPNLSKVWNGTHIFTWKTKHACARPYQTYLEDGEETDIPTEDQEPSDPPEDVDDSPANQDLVFPPISPKRGPSITMVLVCSGAVVLGLGYLAIRPPALLRKRVREIRRARFLRGMGETKLLQWAAEEIEMLGNDEFEEDEMVNSRPLLDEEVPLRPSQTRSTFIDYGTAR